VAHGVTAPRATDLPAQAVRPAGDPLSERLDEGRHQHAGTEACVEADDPVALLGIEHGLEGDPEGTMPAWAST
jgi:hypothetical protein